MFSIFIKFIISIFTGWFFPTKLESEPIIENTAEEALDIASKKADQEEEDKRNSEKAKHNSGGIVDSNTKEAHDRKKEIREKAIIAEEKNRILKEEIKKEEEFLYGSKEIHKDLLEKQEEMSKHKCKVCYHTPCICKDDKPWKPIKPVRPVRGK